MISPAFANPFVQLMNPEAVIRAVEAVAAFAAAHRGLVVELDVNPLLVLKDGALAVDALVKMRTP